MAQTVWAHDQDQILNIWYTIQEVCNQSLAICKQKRPLDISRLLINFNHSFWNNGLFTNGQEPWATDDNTQYGMRQIAYFDRASWEVRRVMRWAINLHKSLYSYLSQLQSHQNDDEGLRMDLPLVQHPALSSLSRPGKISAAQVIINEKLAKVLNLQVEWNSNLLKVFQSTPPQDGDGHLRIDWCNKVQRIQSMYSICAIVLNPGIISILNKGNDDIQMNIQGAEQVLPDDLEPGGVVDIYDESDESDQEIDMEEEDVYEALNVFSDLSVT
ncbi:hypothetical protein DFH28DRAFT_1079981 [Melampsora americana]|nr:hypothetical protein DFH28DRAFT_1079981 [Melampsora americana]